MTIPPFHLAFPIRDLEKTKTFYTSVLGCKQGRSTDRWVDFDFYGHQITAHLKPDAFSETEATNPVDGEQVPVRHFGLILNWDQWHQLSEKLQTMEQSFLIKPQIRFEGQVGEQATMFFLDPSGNALEIKAFKDKSQIFAVE